MRYLPLLPLLILAACAATDAAKAPTKEAISLAEELDTRVAGDAQSCISTFAGNAMRIIDDRTLTYRDGRTLWVNRLESRCPGMTPHDTLVVRRFGGRLCRLDTIEPRDFGLDSIGGPRCTLGSFTPYRLVD